MAIRGNVLEELGVKSVINATCELPDTPLPSSLQNDILYLRVDVADKTESQIFPWMHLVSDIVHQVSSFFVILAFVFEQKILTEVKIEWLRGFIIDKILLLIDNSFFFF